MASIADLFGRLLLDDAGFEPAVVKSATKAGDAAGAVMGQRLNAGLKRFGGAALTGLLVGAAANVAALDDQVKRFQADVGATDEEAKSAASATTALYGAHRAGFDQILGTLAKLRTDQGLTEAQAEKLAGAYLSFANVAGGDGATAVKSFDDILDAFNLSADQGVGIMDKLVISHQKYGGSITGNVAALKDLAPALQGLNLGVDDGIALLNLFASSGLDASAATRALNTAVKNLKPGQTFDDLIRQISSIENPTLRAQKAMEIFGTRGGTALAQALRPGVTALSAFGVSATDAAGATEAASLKIDSSLPKQFELALRGIQGALIDLIGPAGSIAYVIAGLVTLGTAFDTLKLHAVEGWLAVLGPIALAAGAGAAFVLAIKLGVDAISDQAKATTAAAVAAGDLTGAQAALKAQLDAGLISLDEYDAKLKNVQDQQYQQAAAAALATDATNAQADAAGKAAVAADVGSAAASTLSEAQSHAAGAAQLLEARTSSLAGATDSAAAAAVAAAPAFSTMATNVEELTSRSGDAFDALQKLATSSGGPFADAWAAYVNATTPAAEALALIAYRAAAATRNLGAMNSATSAAGQAQINRLRQLGETPDLLKLFGGVEVVPFEFTTTIDVPKVTKAKTTITDAARVAKVDLTAAFNTAKAAADALFDALHARALKGIEDERNLAYATAERTAAEARYNLEKAKEALFAPVDAEQAALDARQAAQQRAGLARGVADASRALRENLDPQRVADLRQQLLAAVAALKDYDAQAKINADRAQAQAAADALTAANVVDPVTGKTKIDADEEAAKAAADAKAATAQTAADKEYTINKKAFDDKLALYEKELNATKDTSKREAILARIQALYDKYGLNAADKALASGKLIALALAEGLKSETKAVEKGAESLVAAINKYISVHSPAEAGPWAVDPPDSMGRRAVRLFSAAMQREAAAFRGLTLPSLGLGSMSLASPAALGAASIGGQAASATVARQPFQIDLGDWFSRTFGAPRFLEYVETGLVKRSRS